MIHEKNTLDPKTHSVTVELWDDFGHAQTVVHPTHTAVEDPAKPFPLGKVRIVPYDAGQKLENIRHMMRERELAFLAHCLESGHAQHPAVLAHPDHPENLGKAAAAASVDEKDCGCGPK
ncbi:MAG TPA: hypothetical protein VGQ12_07590 [Candidatus Angelobacter sp.]|jgi:hypothetical protein|nr:hypothetical protein [Candidatus Angelobacter sp.]